MAKKPEEKPATEALPSDIIDGDAAPIERPILGLRPTESFETVLPAKEQIAATLAYVLMGILGMTIGVHYVITTIIALNADPDKFDQQYKAVGQIFNTLMPILSGLVGSALTYYFTREIQTKKPDAR